MGEEKSKRKMNAKRNENPPVLLAVVEQERVCAEVGRVGQRRREELPEVKG